VDHGDTRDKDHDTQVTGTTETELSGTAWDVERLGSDLQKIASKIG
jgi:hypothetical protein